MASCTIRRLLAMLLWSLFLKSTAQDRASTFVVTVHDMAGGPVESATVRLSSLRRIVQVRCGADGTARFVDVIPATYDLEVLARGFVPQFLRSTQILSDRSEPFPITLAVASTATLCGVSNYVDYDNSRSRRIPISGHLKEEDEDRPISGARVDLLDANEKRVIASTRSSKTGGFTFSDVPAGRYDMRVVKEGYWPTEISHFLVAEESSTVLTIFDDKRGHIHVCE